MSRISRSKQDKASRKGGANLDETVPPWPEWNDAVVNSTVWDPNLKEVFPATAKSKKDDKQPPTKGTTRQSRRTMSVKLTDSFLEEDNPSFDDGWRAQVGGFEVGKWIRAKKIGLEAEVVLDIPLLDLVSSNSHILNDGHMKFIVENVACLEVAAQNRSFTSEFPGPNFTPLTESWKPWHHVYAHNTAGMGNPHTPKYNMFGMYFVRLYFMGKWRKLIVDDFLPCDGGGNLLLPVSSKKDLWFPILAKALLRVMSACGENSPFSIITALTGWVRNPSSFRMTDLNDVWSICCSHLLRKSEEEYSIPDDIHCCYMGSSCLNDARHLYESKSQAVFIFANMLESRLDSNDEVHERELLSYISQVTQSEIKIEEYAAWKQHRWFHWAYRHNILKGKIGEIFKKVEAYCPLLDSTSTEETKTKSESEIMEQPYQQLKEYDFEKFMKNVLEMELYYLPSQFENNYRTDAISFPDSGEKPKAQESKSKSVETESRFFESTCSSFYLLADSPYCKRIYFDMIVLTNSKEPPKGYIICERYLWKDDSPGEAVFVMKAQGSSNRVIIEGPGRFSYRIWWNLPNKYFLQIYSNTPFILGNKENLQDIFQEESVSYKIFGEQISNQFTGLINAEYATDMHSTALKGFMNSFFPQNLLQNSSLYQNLIYRIPFDEISEESLMEFILESDLGKLPENVINIVGKLRKLFLNPTFGERILYSRLPEVSERLKTRQSIISLSKKDRLSSIAAKSKDKDPKAKGKPIQLSNEMFFDRPENNIQILKMIMSKEKSFLELYPFRYDDNTKLVLNDYKGKLTLQDLHPFSVAVRMIVNHHSAVPVPCGIHLFIQHEYCRVSVFDIASMEIMPINIDRNSVWRLARSKIGFIILALCFNAGPKKLGKNPELPWKLRILGENEDNLLHQNCHLDTGTLCPIKPPPLTAPVMDTIRGYYIPNSYSLVTKFLITLTQEDVITLQLSSTCPTALLQVVVKNKEGVIVGENTGKGYVFLPAICLNKDEANFENGSFYYTGGIVVKYNSWTLTDDDLNFINMIKEGYILFSDISESHGKFRKKKSTKSSLDNEQSGPSWVLSLITDTKPGKITKLTPDIREFEQFKSSIEETKITERSKQGSELRIKFRSDQEEFLSGGDMADRGSLNDNLDKFELFQYLLNKYK